MLLYYIILLCYYCYYLLYHNYMTRCMLFQIIAGIYMSVCQFFVHLHHTEPRQVYLVKALVRIIYPERAFYILTP